MMTDIEKANELLQSSEFPYTKAQCDAVFALMMQMAKWKDEQYKTAYVVTRCEEHSDYVEKVFFDSKAADNYCSQYNNNPECYSRDVTEINVE